VEGTALRTYGSAGAIHARFLEWAKAGLLESLWKLGLAEYDEFEDLPGDGRVLMGQ
jgi:hypothetical protein